MFLRKARTLSVLFLLAIIFSPFSAEASVASIFSSIFSSLQKQLKNDSAVFNSQNVVLLQAAVNTDPNPGKGGGDITIVDGTSLLSENGPSGTIVDVENRPQSDHISIYVVRDDDSLSSVAKMFGISVNTIRWANNLTISTVIRPGQILTILSIDSIQHTVANGETLSGIVKKYGGDLNETLAFNGWPIGYEPGVGTVVIVPNGEGEPLTNYRTAVRGTGGPVYAGYYIRPINGGRISQGLHGFNAKDFATYCGAPIFAPAHGTVLVARNQGWNGGYGNYIVIEHGNDTQALLAHLSSIIVAPGWQVMQGQIIGYVGSTGRSTGCHVHLELRGAEFPNI